MNISIWIAMVFYMIFPTAFVVFVLTENIRKERNRKNMSKKFEKIAARKLKALMKKNNIDNYYLLQFEYIDIYNVVQDEIEKMPIGNVRKNELYLVKMHEYYQSMAKDKSFAFMTDAKEMFLKLACFYKANLDMPMFTNEYFEQNSDTEEANKKIVKNVVYSAKSKIKLNLTKDNYKKMFREYYDEYQNEIYLIASSLIDME